MGELIIADDVATLLGPEAVKAVRAQHREDPTFVCMACSTDADTTDHDTSVIALVGPDTSVVVRMVHASCGPSEILNTPITIEERLTERAQRPDPADDVIALAGLMPVAGKQRPVLLLGTHVAMRFITDVGDTIDPWIASLLALGFHLTPTWDQLPPRMKGTARVLVRENGSGDIGNDQVILLDRLPDLPPGWRELALRTKTVTVLAGRGILPDATEQGVETATLLASLDAAAQAGNLVGAQVRAVGAGPMLTPSTRAQAATRESLAADLKRIARAEANDPSAALEAGEPVTQLPAGSSVEVFAVDREDGHLLPHIVISLGGTPAERAAVWADLDAAGFPQVTDMMQPPLLDGWGCMASPSQVLITAPEREPGLGERTLLDSPIDPDLGFYDMATAHPASRVGLVVIDRDNIAGEITVDELQVAASQGRLAWGLLDFTSAS